MLEQFFLGFVLYFQKIKVSGEFSLPFSRYRGPKLDLFFFFFDFFNSKSSFFCSTVNLVLFSIKMAKWPKMGHRVLVLA